MKLTIAWQSAAFPRPSKKMLSFLVRRALILAGLPGEESGGEWEISLLFLPDKAMAKVNLDCLGHEGTTDVITFSYFDSADACPEQSIELLIGVEVACREGARRQRSSYARELVLYIVHGLLHSSSYDDLTAPERTRMRRAERRIMKKLEDEFDFTVIFPAPERFPVAE